MARRGGNDNIFWWALLAFCLLAGASGLWRLANRVSDWRGANPDEGAPSTLCLTIKNHSAMARPTNLASPTSETLSRFCSPYCVHVTVGLATASRYPDILGHVTFDGLPKGSCAVSVSFLDRVALTRFHSPNLNLQSGDNAGQVIINSDDLAEHAHLMLQANPSYFYGWAYPRWSLPKSYGEDYEVGPLTAQFTLDVTPKGPPFPGWTFPQSMESASSASIYPYGGRGFPATACSLELRFKGRVVHQWDQGLVPGRTIVRVPDTPSIRSAFREATKAR